MRFKSALWFVMIIILIVHSESTILWSDNLDVYPSTNWTTLRNIILEVDSTNCPSSNNCWNVAGNGEAIYTGINTLGYQYLSVTFGIAVNLGNDDLCEVYYRYSLSWWKLSDYDAATTSMKNTTLTISALANNKDTFELRFVNTGTQKNTDSCYIDNVSISGTAIISPTTKLPTLSPNTQPITNILSTQSPSTTQQNKQDTIEIDENVIDIMIGSIGWFLLASCIMGTFCICPIVSVFYLFIRDVITETFGVITTAIIDSKEHQKTVRKGGGHRHSYYMNYKYFISQDEWIIGHRQISEDTFNDISTGQQIEIKYLPYNPTWSLPTYDYFSYCKSCCGICVGSILFAGFFILMFVFWESMEIAICIVIVGFIFALPCLCWIMCSENNMYGCHCGNCRISVCAFRV